MEKKFFTFISFSRLSWSIRIMALLVVLILQPLIAHAFSVPWQCDFETGSLSACGLNAMWPQGGCNGMTSQVSAGGAHTGSYGVRVNECPGDNVGDGGFYGSIDSSPTELWVRWYMRYPAGFAWSNMQYQKLIYFHQSASNYTYAGIFGDTFAMELPSSRASIGYGWNSIMGGNSGDGLWHCYEIHVSIGGIFEFWLDGTKRGSVSGVNYGMSNFGGLLEFATNQAFPSTAGYVDWDDMAISTTGYIGPLGGGSPSTHVPDPPINVK